MNESVVKRYEQAKEQYQSLGVDTDKAIKTLLQIRISLHCWQGDDVGGYENAGAKGGGIMATGNYPGRARIADELRMDVEKTMSLIPGSHKLNLHSIYAETNGEKVPRNKVEPRHFSRWIDWAKERNIGLDFNPSFFAHPMASTGFTLSSHDQKVREFWVEHGIACRKIAAAMGSELGIACVNNIWIPDGYKDVPADQKTPREILARSLDEMCAEKFKPGQMRDAVESKLFGLASESYVTGSHEFYMGYAMKNNLELCLDVGHFHPTETIGGKLSSVLGFIDRVLLHVSRGVRWDSDHVPLFSDDLRDLTQQLVRGDFLDRVDIATDWFDASINRIAAWVIGVRNVQKALLAALLEPYTTLCAFERDYDYTSRLALQEELKTLPLGAVWDYACEKSGVAVGIDWLKEVKQYETAVLSKRS